VDFVRDNPGKPVPEETFTHSHSSWSSIIPICFLWHPPYSIHVFYRLFPQSLSKFSLVYLLAWHPPLHTPYISSPNNYLLFTTHDHTIATCFAVVLRLCHLNLVSLSTLYSELYLVTSHHTSILPFSSLHSEVPPVTKKGQKLVQIVHLVQCSQRQSMFHSLYFLKYFHKTDSVQLPVYSLAKLLFLRT